MSAVDVVLGIILVTLIGIKPHCSSHYPRHATRNTHSFCAGDFLLQLAASLLNYRALGQPLPLEFSDVYDMAEYARSGEYTRAKTVFNKLNASFELMVLLLFWLPLCGFEQLDSLVYAILPPTSEADDRWREIPR